MFKNIGAWKYEKPSNLISGDKNYHVSDANMLDGNSFITFIEGKNCELEDKAIETIKNVIQKKK